MRSVRFLCCVFCIAPLIVNLPYAHAQKVSWRYQCKAYHVKIASDPVFLPLAAQPTFPSLPACWAKDVIKFADGGLTHTNGRTEVCATDFATRCLLSSFTNPPCTPSFYVRDNNHRSSLPTFFGQLTGSLWEHGAGSKNTLVSPTTECLILGQDGFHVTVGPCLVPGAAENRNGHKSGMQVHEPAVEAIAATRQDTSPRIGNEVPVKSQDSPQPRSLILTAIVGMISGFVGWNRRQDRSFIGA